jgi:hypothetical protein
VLRDAVLPSEFFSLPETNIKNGLTGYFLSSRLGVRRVTVLSEDVGRIAVTDKEEKEHAIVFRSDEEQWIRDWTLGDKQRLGLAREMKAKISSPERNIEQVTKKKLRLSTVQKIEQLRMPKAIDL